MMSPPFNRQIFNITADELRDIICDYKRKESENEDKDARLQGRIAAIFVILVVSTAAAVMPLLFKRFQRHKIVLWLYDFARYVGSGIIISAAFFHLLVPALGAIGPGSCIGMTGRWKDYPWFAAIVLASIMFLFLSHLSSQQYVDRNYGIAHGSSIPEIITVPPEASEGNSLPQHNAVTSPLASVRSYPLESLPPLALTTNDNEATSPATSQESLPKPDPLPSPSFKEELMAFSILESGVIFHSVIIGLNLGTTSSAQLKSLVIVLIFHQAFEGLGLGARLSAIEFPKKYRWIKWALCAGYGLTTPISIAIGIKLRNTYDSGSDTAMIVSGVLDSISAGILIYTGLVELLAGDFLYNKEIKKKSVGWVRLMVFWVFLGGGIMAFLGIWA